MATHAFYYKQLTISPPQETPMPTVSSGYPYQWRIDCTDVNGREEGFAENIQVRSSLASKFPAAASTQLESRYRRQLCCCVTYRQRVGLERHFLPSFLPAASSPPITQPPLAWLVTDSYYILNRASSHPLSYPITV